MKTIQEREWRDYRGNTQPTSKEGNPNAMVSDVLLSVASFYAPTEGLTLNTDDIRKFNRAKNKLEQPPVDGQLEFEDAHYEVLKRVVVYLIPNHPALFLSAGEVVDLFKQGDDG